MGLLAALRHHQNRAARLAAAVFACGWLGFAVAPCQAMGAMTEEAPHRGSMPMDDCGHCPPATDTAPDCADAAPVNCFSSAPPAIELRQTEQPKPVAILPAAPADASALAPVPRPPRSPHAHPGPIPHASLQQRYCSYLK
jgi:hypothetical protein